MSLYVTDTHALLWYLGGSNQLSTPAHLAFDEAMQQTSQVIIPAIVIAEMVLLVERRRVMADLSRMIATLKRQAGFQLVPLLPEVALQIRALIALPDIHDRLIVAETQAHNATLITRDMTITAARLVQTLW